MAKQETTDSYRSIEAVTARSAEATAKTIVRQFGDPNSGDYRDPYATEILGSAVEVTMKPRVPVNPQEGMSFS